MESLELEYFKAFFDKVQLPNDNCNNVLLYGENGAGKSSLFDALRYVFYKDRIEKIDELLPPADQQAQLNATKESYKNHKSVHPFLVKFNGEDIYSVDVSNYQAFMLNRFDKTDQISLYGVLNKGELPIDIDAFVAANSSFIVKNVNEELTNRFLEPIEISVVDDKDGYVVVLRNKETGLSRSQDLSKYFNEAIINLVQLLIWFTSVQQMLEKTKRRILVLDDFITSLDAANRASMMKYVLTTFRCEQLIILTHDYSLYNITSYLIRYIEQVEDEWRRFKLYSTEQGHCLVQLERIKVQDLQKEYENRRCDYEMLGNKVRKCFEQLLHDLSIELSIGTLEETRTIIDRIANNKTIYWKRGSTLQELVSNLETLVPSITDVTIRNRFLDLLGQYKLKKANKLKDTVCSLRLYQKIAMHPLSHGVLGVPHFTKKDVRQSLILLEKLEKSVYSIEDGKI